MTTFTITEAKRSLGALLKRAVAGEDIGIISGAQIVALRRVDVISADLAAAAPSSPGALILQEPAPGYPQFVPLQSGPDTDLSTRHDDYLYGSKA